MIGGTMGTYAILAGRSLAGFITALLLAFVGDLSGRVFNLLIEYPWPLEVHLNIHLVAIGAGAGIGAYLAWINLTLSRYLTLGLPLATNLGQHQRWRATSEEYENRHSRDCRQAEGNLGNHLISWTKYRSI